MRAENNLHKIGFVSLLFLAMLVNILGQAIHETGHSLVFQVMGRNPVWGFTKIVQIWDTPPSNPEEWTKTSFEGDPGWLKISSPQESSTEKAVSIAAGPLAGLLAAILGLALSKKGGSTAIKQIGLALTLSISFVAVLYYLRSPSRVGGDEYELAKLLSMSAAPINIFFGLGFGFCLFIAIRELPSWRTSLRWLGTVFLGSAATGAFLFFADNYVISQVNAGNPWFQPVLGYAFPVFLINILAFVGLWAWYTRQKKL
jgi:hypothetical protein